MTRADSPSSPHQGWRVHLCPNAAWTCAWPLRSPEGGTARSGTRPDQRDRNAETWGRRGPEGAGEQETGNATDDGEPVITAHAGEEALGAVVTNPLEHGKGQRAAAGRA